MGGGEDRDTFRIAHGNSAVRPLLFLLSAGVLSLWSAEKVGNGVRELPDLVGAGGREGGKGRGEVAETRRGGGWGLLR